ncbi:MAG: marine proteobacterial sortase target protein [Proteobacteria bacterium]|nr:marine proteobacterial sortase target protein [Pseudomonadota bacterium]
MSDKITTTRHIRQQLEVLHQQKKYIDVSHLNPRNKQKAQSKYQGLGLNWRDIVILSLFLFFIGLHQVNAQDYFNLDDIDTGMMLSYHEKGNNYAALELLSADYNITITGIVAQVNIKQSFKNTTTELITEGMYAFPVAEKAAVYQMKLIIGKRVIEGEIHEKQQAQAIYQEAKEQGLSASIVKQYRPNLFTTEVANILPNEIVQVEITYQQTLNYDAGHIDFRLPLAIKNRYIPQQTLTHLADPSLEESIVLPKSSINDQSTRTISINLEAGFALSELKSLNHDVNIQQHQFSQSIQLRDQQLYDMHDFHLRWYPVIGNEPQAAMFSEKLNGEEYVLMMLLPPANTQKIEQKREVVFIIDTSGSMQGAALNAAKDALLFGLTQIDAQDKFNIVEFNSFARELFPQSVIASADNLDKAIDFIDGLHSDGGTNMEPALQFAMQDDIASDYLKQIIFITDGSVGNEAQLFRQISQNINAARLFTVAIGAAPNNYFMAKAALIGKGTYTNISKLDNVDAEMNELFIKLSSPALIDVEVEWGTQVQQNPKIIPDLYSDQPIIVTAKMQGFNQQISLSGFAGKSTFAQSFALHKDGQSAGIAKLWARNQIEDLTDDLMLGVDADSDIIKQEITNIALQYHLVSQFTSLVAVDKTPELSRLAAVQAQLNNTLENIDTVSFPQTALGWKLQIILGLMLIMLAYFSRTQIRT